MYRVVIKRLTYLIQKENQKIDFNYKLYEPSFGVKLVNRMHCYNNLTFVNN
jgi:hypothetical protein